ncbi:MAG: RhuM family protein [Coriobacteriales bacterium]
MENSIVLFESEDGQVTLPVQVDAARQEIWLSRAQLSALFGRDVKTIGKHVNNALREELAGQEDVVVAIIATTTRHGAIEGKTQTHLVEHYGLDMILSVGYRVKSRRGVEFRRWATDVLRRYIVDGNAANERRLRQLGQVASVMARIPESIETRQVLDIVQSYTAALDLLDRNDALFVDGRKAIDDSTLVAVTVMIAESKPEEKDAMVALVMNFLAMNAGEQAKVVR